jgi:hypothetical protein
VRGLLWLAAVAVMLAAASYQRRTGPTYPLRGAVEVGGEAVEYELVRSGTSTGDARVEIAVPGEETTGVLAWRRYPVDEAYRAVPLERVDGVLTAALPRQPPAGKLEYHLELDGPGGPVRVPAEDDPVIRFKDPVPLAALIPHVLLMFFAILVGVRAGLGAALGREDPRRWAWTALGLMTIGGMILGPIVQKFAFGAFWTGIPFGYDLTDNKTLLMWLVWLLACAALGARASGPSRERVGRAAVVLAAVVMLGVYLVPHSFRGSELDYEQLDEGRDPADAIRTG